MDKKVVRLVIITFIASLCIGYFSSSLLSSKRDVNTVKIPSKVPSSPKTKPPNTSQRSNFCQPRRPSPGPKDKVIPLHKDDIKWMNEQIAKYKAQYEGQEIDQIKIGSIQHKNVEVESWNPDSVRLKLPNGKIHILELESSEKELQVLLSFNEKLWAFFHIHRKSLSTNE